MAGDFVEDVAVDVAGVLWSVKKILAAIEHTSFLIEILLLALTAFVGVLTVFFALKVIRVIFTFLKMVYEKISGKFGTINFSVRSIPRKILNFVRRRR